MLSKGELKSIIAAADAAGLPDSAEVKVKRAIDNGLIKLAKYPIEVHLKDVVLSPDAQNNWSAQVTEADALVINEAASE